MNDSIDQWGASEAMKPDALAAASDRVIGSPPSTDQLAKTRSMYESDKSGSEASRTDQSESIRGIALDMDGLLFDTERLYWQVGDTVLQRRGHRFSKDLQQRMMGRVAMAALQEMINFHSLDDSPQQLLDESDELFSAMLTDQLQPMPGLGQWIEFVQQREIPFGLATSSRRKFVDLIFETIPWRDSLSFTLTGEDVSRGKPDPEMYLLAANRLAIAPAEMLVLEDSGNGCAAAVAAGARTVAIPSDHTRDQNFDGAAMIAESLTDPRLWSLLTK